MKLNDLDLNKLHVFRVLAESRSMREAGERLLRTPSAISQSVTGLEKSLGLRLFDRNGIRLDLTDSGKSLLRQVRSSESGLLQVLEQIRGRPAEVRGQVSLGLPPGYPAGSLSKGLSAALVKHPGIQLRLRFLTHAELAEGLLKGRLDMAVSLQPLRQRHRKIRSLKLRDETLVLVGPPELMAQQDDELPIVDYFQQPMMIEGWLKHHRLKKARARTRVFASNLDHVLEMVRAGVGCAVVPRHRVASELASGEWAEHRLDRKRPWVSGVWLNAVRSDGDFLAAPKKVWEGLRKP